MKDKISGSIRSDRAIGKKYFSYILTVIVSVGLTLLIMEFYEQAVKKDLVEEPYVAIVLSEQSLDPIPGEFLSGFRLKMKDKPFLKSKEGKKVKFEIFEDLGSIEESSRIARMLSKDKNCIMVIGNSNSTLTGVTLDIFLGSNDPPTYILPIATDSDLMAKAKARGCGVILRMVPDNTKQAETIVRLIATLSPKKRVAIYGDQENEGYSLGLSRDIANIVRQMHGKVLIEEMIGPTNSFYNTRNQWLLSNEKAPEVLVYAGIAHHGLLLIDQFSELGRVTPIIFSDGCMVEAFHKSVGKLNGRSFVLSPVEFGIGNAKMPTYEPIGRDAHTLASFILSACEEYTRKAVREFVSKKKENIIFQGHAGKYQFDSDGNNIAMPYLVYEATTNKIEKIENLEQASSEKEPDTH